MNAPPDPSVTVITERIEQLCILDPIHMSPEMLLEVLSYCKILLRTIENMEHVINDVLDNDVSYM